MYERGRQSGWDIEKEIYIIKKGSREEKKYKLRASVGVLHHRIVRAWVRWEFVSSRTGFKTSSLPLQFTEKQASPITYKRL